MIDKITFIEYLDTTIAIFSTINQTEGPDKGTRVKHRVHKDECGWYWVEKTWLSKCLEPEYTSFTYVSERKFFGKVRLAATRYACLPETWMAIADVVKQIETMKKKEEKK